MRDKDEKKYLHALIMASQGEYHALADALMRSSSYKNAWLAALQSAKKHPSRPPGHMPERPIEPDEEWRRLEKNGIALITPDDQEFPLLLTRIPSPPLWLYIKGGARREEPALAVVGSRKMSSYGKEATEQIIAGVADRTDACIVSGLAIGIDGAAHRSALANHLRTIAVLGSGIDAPSLYPQSHVRLAEEIVAKGGAVFSEYPPGSPAFKHHFIQRNRLIAGLAAATIVVEAQEKSGALITARFALEQGRDVFAVPGSIFSPYSRGANALIAEGASPAISADAILTDLNFPEKIRTGTPDALTAGPQRIILEHLAEPRTIDDLRTIAGMHTPDIVSSLSMLELEGRIKRIGNGVWVRV